MSNIEGNNSLVIRWMGILLGENNSVIFILNSSRGWVMGLNSFKEELAFLLFLEQISCLKVEPIFNLCKNFIFQERKQKAAKKCFLLLK